jgi:hypothetical protein
LTGCSGDSSSYPTTMPFTFSIAPGLVHTFLSVKNQLPAPATTIVGIPQVVGDPTVISNGTGTLGCEDGCAD